MSLAGRFVSISGSAGPGADRAELARAHAFVGLLAAGVIELGGGLVEVLSKDPRIVEDDAATGQTFFWTIADALLRAAV